MLSTPSTLAAVADDIVRAARRAAAEVAAICATGQLGVEHKGPNDPVTRADKAANAILVDALTEGYPGVPVVAEESPEGAYEGYGASPRAFFVDPIDGTRELVAGNGEYSLMVGLAERGEAVLGVVLWPARGLVYVGIRDMGAWSVDDAGAKRPLSLTDVRSLADARVVVSRSRTDEAATKILSRLGARELLRAGSVGVKAAMLTAHDADLYAHPIDKPMKLWDVCAPDALVRAAGGVLTDARGVPFDYGAGVLAMGHGALAGNATLHALAVDALSPQTEPA
ncbi:MAG: 3'(2'),5'-bisphosphate nucleotidase CysQ [Polyangiaceae bacterium]